MKVLLAFDSFKGSMSSLLVANSFERGFKKVYTDADIIKVAVADGGEGTVESLVLGSDGEMVFLSVDDPLRRKIKSFYGILGDKKTAVIEMASASGLPLLKYGERNPRKTSTYGTGQLIKDAIEKGCRNFIIGIGGSATQDGGMGMLSALGFNFLDSNGELIEPSGENLIKINKIDTSNVIKGLEDCKFLVACDVNNPMYGKNGSSEVYAKQKGANASDIIYLDSCLKHFSEIINKTFNKDVGNIPGSGAAGGLGGGFLGFLNAELKSGIDIVLELVGIEEKLKDVDLVVTGEGKIDSQTSMGKTPVGVAKIAKKFGVPVIAIAGCVSDDAFLVHEKGIDSVFSIINYPLSHEDALKEETSVKFVEKTAEEIARLITIFRRV